MSTLPSKRRRFGLFRLLLLFVLAVVIVLVEPHSYRWLVGKLVGIEAARRGMTAQIGAVEGRLLDPVTLVDLRLSYQGGSGETMHVEVKKAVADIRWNDLFRRGKTRWFQRLTLDGVSGKVDVPAVPPASVERSASGWRLPWPRGRWVQNPVRIEAKLSDWTIQNGANDVRIEACEFSASEVEPGTIKARRVSFRQPWLKRDLLNISGATSLHDSRLQITGMRLDQGVEIRSFTADAGDLARGRLDLALDGDVFGGAVRAEARTVPGERELTLDASGDFSNVQVAGMAAFLGISDAAGGLLKTGNFGFRGSPHRPERAFARLRLDAENFQWETRQWDRLTLGLEMRDGALQIHDLKLVQAQNQIALNGRVGRATPGQAWWKADGQWSISAQIQNLTELGALLLPEFRFTAGTARVDGSITSTAGKLNGQLLANGANLSWRGAPIQSFVASVLLAGDQARIGIIELKNARDTVRVTGQVPFDKKAPADLQVEATVRDLSPYRALLETLAVPQPLPNGPALWLPTAGTLDATFTLTGPLESPQTNGQLVITNGRLPLTSGGEIYPINASMGFVRSEIVIEALNAEHPLGALTMTGKVSLENSADPKLELAVSSPRFAYRDGALELQTALDLRVNGPFSSALIKGTANTLGATYQPTQILGMWLSPDLHRWTGRVPIEGWQLDLQITGQGPLRRGDRTGDIEKTATLTTSLHLSGPAKQPLADGELNVTAVDASWLGQLAKLQKGGFIFVGDAAFGRLSADFGEVRVEQTGSVGIQFALRQIITPTPWLDAPQLDATLPSADGKISLQLPINADEIPIFRPTAPTP